MTNIRNTFWELGTNVNSTEVTNTRGIRIKMVATASSATVTLYIVMDAFTYFQVISSGIITVEDSTKAIYDGITSSTSGWVSCTPAKWTDTTYNIVSNSNNGLVPKVINTNTNTIGNTYYVLASSNGSNNPSWYKLPATAFTTYSVFTGASDTAAGSTGLVPAPASKDNRRYLCGDGTWKNVYELYWETDTRNVATIPSDYKRTFKLVGIKTPSVIGLDSSVGYVSVIGWKGYLDNSGPKAWELASDNKQRLHVRSGSGIQSNGGGNEDWSAWNTLAYTTDNFPSNQIDKLTGYTKADTIEALNVDDTLNKALGKLEFKTDFIYNDLFGTDNDDVINKWHEIVNFIDSVKETETDILDTFVTRKTA